MIWIAAVQSSECFVEDFFYPLYEYFGSAHPFECPPHVVDCLDWLRSLRCSTNSDRGLRLALVTNFDARAHNIVAGLQLSRYFDEVITLHEAHSAKPDPASIQLAKPGPTRPMPRT